jgi:dethiobiotin synthetase
MPARLIVVTGTGTGIGKTHLAEALVLAWRRRLPRVAGVKPVESGVTDPRESDTERLRRASSFHVKHGDLFFPDPVSPHLAARRAGTLLTVPALVRAVAEARALADGVVAELPGGLFTPLAPDLINADLVQRLEPDSVLLAAPDRLGVLHDVNATVRAASALGLALAGVVLIAPEHPDASTGTNAAELSHFVPIPVLVTVPRAAPADLIPIVDPLLGPRVATPTSAVAP